MTFFSFKHQLTATVVFFVRLSHDQASQNSSIAPFLAEKLLEVGCYGGRGESISLKDVSAGSLSMSSGQPHSHLSMYGQN